MLLLVRNVLPGPTVFAKPDVLRESWGPAGDATGRDVRRVSDKLLDDPDFLDALERGVLVIDNAGHPEVSQRLEAHRLDLERYQSHPATQPSIMEGVVVERRQDRDVVAESCIGPGAAGRTLRCEAQVLRPAREVAESPPLCERHKSLAANFVLVTTGSKGDQHNPLTHTWTKATLR